MLKYLRLLLLALLLTLPLHAVCEEVTFHELTFSADAQSIDLADLAVSMDELTAFLDQFPALTHVDMFGTKVQKADIELLTERYPDVTFGWTIHIFGKGKGHDVRTDQTAFSTLHGDCFSHYSNQLDVLRYCTELRALDIGHNLVNDLSFLSDLKELRVLILACNCIEDISVLAELDKLEYLELFSNNIHDLSPLANLTHLMDLNLTYTRPKNIDMLYEMPFLKRLWMGHSYPLDKKSLGELQEALPDTELIAHGDPTQNGWRIHPHYDVLHDMFASGVYIPFDDSWTE